MYWTDADERVMIATLDGQLVTDHRPMTRVTAPVTADRDGVSQTGFSNIAAREDFAWYTDERLDRMVKEAVDRTVILFEAMRPPAGEMPVVLAAGASGILLHEAIGHGMEADFNRKGTRIYSDKIGKPIAKPFVTIVDDGTQAARARRDQRRRRGQRAGRTMLVENGVLTHLPARLRSPRSTTASSPPATGGASATTTRRCRACAPPTCCPARTRTTRSSPR